ncbi:4a-hydroxytetrahydrobiopterin dehydratase [Glycomyces scopariae]
MTEGEIDLALSDLPGWSHANDRLERTWTFPGHLQALAAATGVGLLSERRDHHADLTVNYDKLRVSVTSHSAGDKVSAKDTDLARAVSDLLG